MSIQATESSTPEIHRAESRLIKHSLSIPAEQGGFGADSGVDQQERIALPYQGYILPNELRKAMT
jgi:hypothetical protein